MSEDEFIDFKRDDILQLMVASGASEDEARSVIDEQADTLNSALQKLAQHEFNQIATTQPRVVVGRYHFRLRKAIVNSIRLSSGLLTAGISLVAFPVFPLAAAGVVAGAAAAVATTIDTLGDMFTKMTDEEVYVYQSILDIATNDRANNTDIAKKLTADRLKQWFKDHYEAPPHQLDAILADLEKKGVLKRTGYENQAKYSIVN